MTRRKIACLITGMPRGYQRCFETLRFLLKECDVTYYAVIREEFTTERTIRGLHQALPGIRLVIVPHADSAAAVAGAGGKLAGTVVQMWHEIQYGARAIRNMHGFDAILRTRFDLFFHRQFLPETGRAPAGTVWIPEQLSWSGSNDMLCLARPQEFAAYADTYDRLGAVAREGATAPEGVLSRALAHAGLREEKLDIFFILYREALFATLTDAQLQVLTYVHPALSAYKLGGPRDSAQSRADCTALANSLTQAESMMPLFGVAHVGQQFGAPEIDARDGSIFRWMGMHAQVRRALAAGTREIRFTLHYYVAGWSIEHLQVAVDGNAVALCVTGHDAFGRPQVCGTIERVRPLRRPWSRITFFSTVSAVPSQTGANPRDHRSLSVALGQLDFIEAGDEGHADQVLALPWHTLRRVVTTRVLLRDRHAK